MDMQPAAGGVQPGITIVAVVGWLIGLGVVLVVEMLLYQYKRKTHASAHSKLTT